MWIILLAACKDPGSSVDTGAPPFAGAPLLELDSDAGLAHLVVRSSPQPPEVAVVAFEYTVTDADGAPVDGLEIRVEPWMPTMGMGTSVVPTVEAQGDGVYQVIDVDLVMGGTWELETTFSGAVDDTAAPLFDVR